MIFVSTISYLKPKKKKLARWLWVCICSSSSFIVSSVYFYHTISWAEVSLPPVCVLDDDESKLFFATSVYQPPTPVPHPQYREDILKRKRTLDPDPRTVSVLISGQTDLQHLPLVRFVENRPLPPTKRDAVVYIFFSWLPCAIEKK